MAHNHLAIAKVKVNDEFYTRLEDISAEVFHYKMYLRNKVVYCNCDDPSSMFRKYFIENFHELKLKRFYCSGISGKYLDFDGNRTIEYLGDGDFRSTDSKSLLEKSDIIITNVPFSLFREYINQVKGKRFLIIGNKNAISYQEVFPLIKEGAIRLGYTRPNKFVGISAEEKNLTGLCRWFTNLPVNKPVSSMLLVNKPCSSYQSFDNYPAINVDKVKEIPANYNGLMGVPITVLDSLDISSFEIVDLIARHAVINHEECCLQHDCR